MTEQELTSKLNKLGYTRLWLDFGVLTTEQLLEQEQLFDQGEDTNTEHYRYSTCNHYLRSKKELSDLELERFFRILQNDPDTYMAGSAGIELFKQIDLTDKQFASVSEVMSQFGDWTGKTILRHRFLRTLQKEPTHELIHDAVRNGDSFVQSYLLEHLELDREQLEALFLHGKNKQIRSAAKQQLD